ncbi:MAG: RsmE family RNA methyltransferase [Eudoraea sp.]|nr:RsmE family RNA methyltransferase [Eudoraea sp.]
MMNVFYAYPLDRDLLLLDEPESRHCVRVLRTRLGDKVHAVDGLGSFYEGELADDNPKECKIRILKKIDDFHPLPYELHIGIAPTKSIDRFEWFLEKATEIGVSSVTPLLCERSERKILRTDRLEKVVISAMKQSMKAYKPILHQAIDFQEWMKHGEDDIKLIAYCTGGNKENLWQMKLPGRIKLAIGPEGDFSSNEVTQAVKNGFISISLGEYRLRTETAGIIACSAIYFNKHQ